MVEIPNRKLVFGFIMITYLLEENCQLSISTNGYSADTLTNKLNFIRILQFNPVEHCERNLKILGVFFLGGGGDDELGLSYPSVSFSRYQ